MATNTSKECHLGRGDVSGIVVLFVRAQGFPNATEASDFDQDIPVDGEVRGGWAGPLTAQVIQAGCDPTGFGPNDCENAGTVGDIVDALFGAIQ